MIRMLRGLGALVVLVLVLVGAPWLLLRLGGPAAVSRIPWRDLLHQPDNGDLLIVILSLVGWLAWAHLALTVASEALTIFTRHRVVIPVPGSRLTRPVAGALVAALAGLVLAQALRSPAAQSVQSPAAVPSPSTRTAAAPSPDQEPGGPSAAAGPRATPTPLLASPTPPEPRSEEPATAAAPNAAPVAPTADPRPGSYIVRPGDDLWTLAVTLFDDGLRWRTLATANRLDPDQPLLPGTVLVVPTLTQADVSRLTRQGEIDTSERSIVVHPGDTLAGLAARHLGSAAHWPALQGANPTLVLDPDHLEPGWVLHLPPRLAHDADRPSLPSNAPASPDAAADEKLRPGAADPDLRSAGTTARAAAPRVDNSSSPPAPDRPGGGASPAVGSPVGPGAAAESAVDAAGSHDARGLVGGLAVTVLAGVGLGLASRRRGQQWGRPLGRRFRAPERPARRFRQAMSQLAAESPECSATLSPTTVVVGERHEGGACTETVTVTLRDIGRLRVTGPVDLVLAAGGGVGTSLGCAPWSEGTTIVAVGDSLEWLARLDDPAIEVVGDLTAGLSRLDRLLAAVRDESDGQPGTVVVVVDLTGLPSPDRRRAVIDRYEPRLAGPSDVAVVWLCDADDHPADTSGSAPTLTILDEERALLSGRAGEFVPNLVSGPARHALVELFDAATRTDTEPAPWWAPDVDPTPGAPAAGTQAEPSAGVGAAEFGTLTLLTPRDPSAQDLPTITGHLPLAHRPATTDLEDAVPPVPEFLATADHPVLLLLGEVELIGARGPRPSRAVKQCEEYCAWILEHPGRTAVAMTHSLLVAEGTRRSNMSRLRTWLGTDDAGADYLPDAYSGHIRLHAGITTDWEQLRLLISAGVRQAANDALAEALELVRGAPLADAAPGQWHWAEELRIEMASTIRDIGAVLAGRALEVNDLELARWAAARALSAAPEDELLMALRVRTEHLAGNRPEVERLVLHITRQARLLGVDLSDETVTVLQKAMEGRARARRA